KYLVPRQLTEHGLTSGQLEITPEAIQGIIRSYTREAGVRNLEREIASICRGAARKVAEGMTPSSDGQPASIVVGPDDLHEYLGPLRFFRETAERTSTAGVATGLVWTPVGGDIIFVEATSMPGRGGLVLTGYLGEVMQESAQAALSHLRTTASRYHLPDS